MTAVLSLRGLGKDYGARTAVAAIDLDVARGECFGLRAVRNNESLRMSSCARR